jgi:hypothetical protein
MMKNLYLVLALVFISTLCRAQTQNPDKVALSLGFDLFCPQDNAIPGPGFSARAELPLMPQLKFTLSASYFVNYYGPRLYESANPPSGPHVPTGPVNSGPYKFVPVQAGLRYYYFRTFYLEGEAGEAFKANVTDNSFIYGGTVGGLIRFNPHNAIDLGIGYSNGYKYQDYSEKTFEAILRIAYRYQF